jgi:hypothetical protein
MKMCLKSDSLDLPEEWILDMLLLWYESSDAASEEIAKDLLNHVRLPLVPMGWAVMNKAVKLGLVSRE